MFPAGGKSIGAGVLFGVALGVAGTLAWEHHMTRQRPSDTSVIFPDKMMTDIPATDSVFATGRWEGDGVGYKNNAAAIMCNKDRGECLYYSVEQIGVNQIGDLEPPTSLPIKSWDDHVIVASDAGLDGGYTCVRNTINVMRKSETVELVMEPINQAAPNCTKADDKIYKWTLGQSLFWEGIHKASAMSTH